MNRIEVTDRISLREEDLHEDFVRSSGPGGQNVNKVATTVQLVFDVEAADLPPDVVERLRTLAGRRLDSRGRLHIEASRHRTREQNRQDARSRLLELLRQAAQPPRPRKKTRPSSSARKRRLDEKKHHSRRKELRGRVRNDE